MKYNKLKILKRILKLNNFKGLYKSSVNFLNFLKQNILRIVK